MKKIIMEINIDGLSENSMKDLQDTIKVFKEDNFMIKNYQIVQDLEKETKTYKFKTVNE